MSIVTKRILPVALCIAMLTSLLAAGAARAAATASLNVGGTTVDVSRNADGPGWMYRNSYSSSGMQLLILDGYGNGSQTITAAGDLVISAVGTNHVGTLDVSGKLTIIGSGVIVVEEIANWFDVEIGGAALFLQYDRGVYYLLNDGEIHDWATLPAGEFIIPSGRTLTLAARSDAADVLYNSKLTVPAGSSLTVENGGRVVVEQAVTTGRDKLVFHAVLDVKGTLTVSAGGTVNNSGIVYINQGRVKGTLNSTANKGYVRLKARETGAATPLDLIVKGGFLILEAGAGRYSGGVTCDAVSSIYIAGTEWGKEASLDYIHITGGGGTGLYSLHRNEKGVPMGRLSVDVLTNPGGELWLKGVDLSVNDFIQAGYMNVDSSAVSCPEVAVSGEFTTDYSTLNLDSVYASDQNHQNSLIAAPYGQITGVGGGCELAAPGNPVESISGQYIFNIYNDKLFDIGSVYINNSYSGIIPASVGLPSAFGYTGLTFAGLYSYVSGAWGPQYTHNETSYPLYHFIVVGKDSGGQLRVWQVFKDIDGKPATPAPDVSELYAVRAVYTREGPDPGIVVGGSEEYLQNNHTGSGTLGGTGSLSSLTKPGWVKDSENASLSPASASFDKNGGKDVTVRIELNGRAVQSVRSGSYTLRSGTDYAVSGNSYTLKAAWLSTLAAGAHTVTFVMNGGTNPAVVITVIDSKPKNPFKDVLPGAWYYDAVIYLNEKGLMLGTASDTFSPNVELSRAMIVTILYRHAGEPDVSGIKNAFDDTLDGVWYSDAVKWAYSNGIVTGYGNGKFGTNDPVTKEQLAALIHRTQQSDGKAPPAAAGKPYSDLNKVSGWAADVVSALNAQGLFNDIPGASFNPKNPATRAEIASILYKWLTAVE